MANKPMVIGVDVDGVIADLHPAWLALYNKDFNDNVSPEDMKDGWDIMKVVKKECSYEKMVGYLSHVKLYNDVRPIEGAQEGIKALRDAGFHVVLVTTCEPGSEGHKWNWAVRHGFVQVREDWFPVKNKSMVNVDVLIDDKPSNIESFPRTGVIFTQPYNKTYMGGKARLHKWADIGNLINALKPKPKSILDIANEIIHGVRQNDYGSPLANHTRTAEFFTTYLGPKLIPGAALNAEDISMLNILQKVSRGINFITKDTVVDIAGYAANIEMIKNERGEW